MLFPLFGGLGICRVFAITLAVVPIGHLVQISPEVYMCRFYYPALGGDSYRHLDLFLLVHFHHNLPQDTPSGHFP